MFSNGWNFREIPVSHENIRKIKARENPTLYTYIMHLQNVLSIQRIHVIMKTTPSIYNEIFQCVSTSVYIPLVKIL